MDLADAKRLKELEKAKGALQKILAESMLKIRLLEEVNAKFSLNFVHCRGDFAQINA